MKYSAEDILHQSFEKKFRGYDQDQVHEFLQGMSREWDYMSGEIVRLQDDVDGQVRELREFRKRERSLLDALATAKQVAEELNRQAEERGQRIIDEATQRAEQLVANAQRERDALHDDIQRLHKQRAQFANELCDILCAHERLLEDFATSARQPDAIEDATHASGPTIHRRPRTQPPSKTNPHHANASEDVDDEDILHIDQAGPTVVVDQAQNETLHGLAPQ